MSGEKGKELPEGWVETTLGDIADYGKTEKVEPANIDDETWVLELEDIEKSTSKILKMVNFKERKTKSTKNRFEKNDVLYGKLRPYLSKVVVANQNGVCSTEIIPLRSPDGLDYRYLFYALKRPEFLDYVDAISHGLNMPRLGTNAGKAALFPLPPLNEQRRIADKLDIVLGALERCKTRLEKAQTLLKRFRQSTLNATATGKLTADWREERGLEYQYRSAILNDHVKIDIGNAFKSNEFTSQGTRLLRGQNIEPGALRWSDTQCFPSKKLEDFQHLFIDEGDIILAMDRPIVSAGLKLAKARAIDLPCVLVQRVTRFKNFEGLLPDFLYALLSAQPFSIYLGTSQTGSDIPHISGKQILAYSFLLPPLEEQREIVRRVENLFALADRIEARLTATQKRLTRLQASLLAKAFRGQLVPQNPTDEPASLLLERIKAEREATKPAKAKRKKRAKA